MRIVLLSLVAVVGLSLATTEANAQQRYSNGMVYIYPEGTMAYQVGPYNYRSGYYVMPTVTEGFRNGTNVIPNQYYYPNANYNTYSNYPNTQYSNYGQSNWNGYDRRWDGRWDGYRNYRQR